MAVVAVKSIQLTHRDATPRVINTAFASRVRHARGIVTMTSGDDIDSVYKFFSVPSGVIPVSLRVSCPDIGTTTIADFGLYPTTSSLVAGAIDRDLFASAVSLKDGALAKVEILRESTTITVALSMSRLWELIPTPPSTNPGTAYDVAASLTAACDTTAQVLLEMDYVVSIGESQT